MWMLVRNGVAQGQPRENFPPSWENTTGLKWLTDSDRIALGWYPVEVQQDAFDPETEILDEIEYLVTPGVKVVQHWIARAMTAGELAQRAAAVAQSLRQEIDMLPPTADLGDVIDRVNDLIDTLYDQHILTRPLGSP